MLLTMRTRNDLLGRGKSITTVILKINAVNNCVSAFAWLLLLGRIVGPLWTYADGKMFDPI